MNFQAVQAADSAQVTTNSEAYLVGSTIDLGPTARGQFYYEILNQTAAVTLGLQFSNDNLTWFTSDATGLIHHLDPATYNTVNNGTFNGAGQLVSFRYIRLSVKSFTVDTPGAVQFLGGFAA